MSKQSGIWFDGYDSEASSPVVELCSDDVIGSNRRGDFGRQDTPSIEQIVSAAIYKELKQLDYRGLEYHQGDSRICARSVKIDELRPYSFQMYHKYI